MTPKDTWKALKTPGPQDHHCYNCVRYANRLPDNQSKICNKCQPAWSEKGPPEWEWNGEK